MATQLHLAHSASIDGLVSIGGGPYACALGNAERARTQCLQGPSFDLTKLRHVARDAAAVGNIDTLNHVATDRVFVAEAESGMPDARVSFAVTRFYEELLDNGELEFQELPEGSDVDRLTAGLAFIHQSEPRLPTTEGHGALRSMEYSVDKQSSLPGTASIYEPVYCLSNPCDVHLHFTACDAPNALGDNYQSLHKFADSRSLLIVYPDAATNADLFACWDWWGTTTNNYADKNAPQIKAAMSLVKTVLNSN
ncbi:MAG: hypothetical protein AAF385_00995 [Pseudomonadota bacterium]